MKELRETIKQRIKEDNGRFGQMIIYQNISTLTRNKH